MNYHREIHDTPPRKSKQEINAQSYNNNLINMYYNHGIHVSYTITFTWKHLNV